MPTSVLTLPTLQRERYRSVDQVVSEMRRLAVTASTNPTVRSIAIDALADTPRRLGEATGQPRHAEAQALLDFVRRRVRYIPDPVGTEWLQDPLTSYREGAGDCDDSAVFVAALALAVGLPARFRLVARRAGDFDHVYAELRPGATWLAADATLDFDALLGTAVGGVTRSRVVSLIPDLAPAMACPCDSIPYDLDGLGCPGCGGTCGAQDVDGLGNPFGGFNFGGGSPFGGGGNAFDLGFGSDPFGSNAFNPNLFSSNGGAGGSRVPFLDDVLDRLPAIIDVAQDLGILDSGETQEIGGGVIANPPDTPPPSGYQEVTDTETGRRFWVPSAPSSVLPGPGQFEASIGGGGIVPVLVAVGIGAGLFMALRRQK